MKKKVLFLVGPTASAKSEVALALAQKLKGEIISCDAMQLYRGMDIGTAKPTFAEKRKVPHHLLDLVSPRSEFSVFKHRQFALETMDQIFKRKKTPIFIGGSGLYIKAIIDGLAPQPGKQTEARKKFEALAKKESVSHLYERLKAMDPKRARAIHPNDKKRIIRALEILEASGKSQADWELETKGLKSLGIQYVLFGLLWDRKKLYDRIERRVDQMIQQGWVREVKHLKRIGFSKTSKSAIGYHELSAHLRGDCSLLEATNAVKKRTRNLAKKQMTWFKRDKRIRWILVSKDSDLKGAIKLMIQEFTK